MKLSEKLARLKARRGLTTDALAQKSGIPKGTINKVLNGETRNPTIGTLKALAEALECPLEWLGDNGGSAAVPAPRPANIPGVRRLGDATEAHWFDNLLPIVTRRVPLLGTIAAGAPIYAEQELAVADCDNGIHCDFALRVKGDSMIGARIHDGDVVFIRRQDDVADGQIAAVVIDDEATLKRVYHVKNGLQLLSENPKYPPMMFTLAECGVIRILGLAVGFTGRL
jgi:repressor LexA